MKKTLRSYFEAETNLEQVEKACADKCLPFSWGGIDEDEIPSLPCDKLNPQQRQIVYRFACQAGNCVPVFGPPISQHFVRHSLPAFEVSSDGALLFIGAAAIFAVTLALVESPLTLAGVGAGLLFGAGS